MAQDVRVYLSAKRSQLEKFLNPVTKWELINIKRSLKTPYDYILVLTKF